MLQPLGSQESRKDADARLLGGCDSPVTTVRIARRRQFLRMDSRAVNDPGLSFRARGVLAWLLDKPDDWTVSADAISNQGTEGRDAIRRALRELEAAGYLVRTKWRGEDGRYHAEALLYEHPDHSGKPAVEDERRPASGGEPVLLLNPPTGEQPTTKHTSSDDEDAFAAFWSVYPKRADKPAARRAFKAAIKRSHQSVVMAGAERYRDDPTRKPAFTKNPATWLNNDSWENEVGGRPAPDDGWDRDAPGGPMSDAELWAHADRAAGS